MSVVGPSGVDCVEPAGATYSTGPHAEPVTNGPPDPADPPPDLGPSVGEAIAASQDINFGSCGSSSIQAGQIGDFPPFPPAVSVSITLENENGSHLSGIQYSVGVNNLSDSTYNRNVPGPSNGQTSGTYTSNLGTVLTGYGVVVLSLDGSAHYAVPVIGRFLGCSFSAETGVAVEPYAPGGGDTLP